MHRKSTKVDSKWVVGPQRGDAQRHVHRWRACRPTVDPKKWLEGHGIPESDHGCKRN